MIQKNIILSPSILSADFSRLGEQIAIVAESGCTCLHIDVMDGMFVPSISFGCPIIRSIRKVSQLTFDVHLMIQEPERYVTRFAEAGADIITFHYESTSRVSETIQRIHDSGCRCGISIKPDTPVEVLSPYLSEVDMILVMTVEPGFGGQSYIPETTEKICRVRSMISQVDRSIDLQIDGGVNDKILPVVLEAGANVIVAGSYVFSGDIQKNVQNIQTIVEQMKKDR